MLLAVRVCSLASGLRLTPMVMGVRTGRGERLKRLWTMELVHFGA